MSNATLENMNVTLDQAAFTLPRPGQQLDVAIAGLANLTGSAVISAINSSTCVIQPKKLEINSLNITASGSSTCCLGGTEETIMLARGQAIFKIVAPDNTDSSSIEISGLDFLNDDPSLYPKGSYRFIFDTQNQSRKNFGKFRFPGNGNSMACSKLFSLGLVYINDQQFTTYDTHIFLAENGDSLTLSLTNR